MSSSLEQLYIASVLFPLLPNWPLLVLEDVLVSKPDTSCSTMEATTYCKDNRENYTAHGNKIQMILLWYQLEVS